MKERFLPIGTIVLLKGGTKELMITSYCIFRKSGTEKEKQEMFDYGGCVYPEGIMNSEVIYAFNHDQINNIIFEGYETEKSKELSRVLNGGCEIYKKKISEKK